MASPTKSDNRKHLRRLVAASKTYINFAASWRLLLASASSCRYWLQNTVIKHQIKVTKHNLKILRHHHPIPTRLTTMEQEQQYIRLRMQQSPSQNTPRRAHSRRVQNDVKNMCLRLYRSTHATHPPLSAGSHQNVLSVSHAASPNVPSPQRRRPPLRHHPTYVLHLTPSIPLQASGGWNLLHVQWRRGI